MPETLVYKEFTVRYGLVQFPRRLPANRNIFASRDDQGRAVDIGQNTARVKVQDRARVDQEAVIALRLCEAREHRKIPSVLLQIRFGIHLFRGIRHQGQVIPALCHFHPAGNHLRHHQIRVGGGDRRHQFCDHLRMPGREELGDHPALGNAQHIC